jgi:hypothetical protein
MMPHLCSIDERAAKVNDGKEVRREPRKKPIS